MSKKSTKILVVLAIWAAVTWRFRENLLPVPTPETGPVPPIRHPRPAARGPAAPTAESAGDDLTEVKGVGPVYQGRLTEMGITTFADLAGADADAVAEQLDVAVTAVDDWKRQAGELAG